MQQVTDLVNMVQHFTDLSNTDDLDGLVALFDEHAMIVQLPATPSLYSGVAIGVQAIRAWFAHQMPHLHVERRNIRTYDTIVTWEATISGDAFRHFGLDSFETRSEATIQDGKIIGLQLY